MGGQLRSYSLKFMISLEIILHRHTPYWIHVVLLILYVFKAGHLELDKLSGTPYLENWFSLSQQLLAAYSSLTRLVPCVMSHCCPFSWCGHCIGLVGTTILLSFYRYSFLDVSRRHCLTAAILAIPLALLTFLWCYVNPWLLWEPVFREETQFPSNSSTSCVQSVWHL